MEHRARAIISIVALILCGFGCGSDGPVAPTPIPAPAETPKPPPPPETPTPEPPPPTPETPEPEPPGPEEPEPPKPPPPEAPKPTPEPPTPEPSPPEAPPEPRPPTPEPPTPPAPPEPPEMPTPPEMPEPPQPEPPAPPETPEPPSPPGDYTITCACENVRVGDVIVLRVEPGTGHLTYRWAATPGSDPVPGDSPTPRWNPSGSGRVELTAWVTGDAGTVVVSRSVEVTGNPAPPSPPSPEPPAPPPPAPPDTPKPDPPPPTKPWGAWSGNHDQTIAGVSAGKDSRDEADRAALADCRSKGGTGCTSAGASGGQFQNQCFAIAHGKVTLENPRRPPHCGGPGQHTCPVSPYYQTYVSFDEPTQRAAEAKTMHDCPRGGGALGTGTECRMLASVCQP